ncbi:disulfide bond formation protein B [soil metagenome]
MKNPKAVLLFVAFACLGVIGAALYMQHAKDMAPCPWCVIQRYCFLLVALICLIAAAFPRGATRAGAGVGMLAALGGAGSASWHLWVKAHPEVSCGIDPLETSLNKIPPAELMPYLFKADGFCTTEYPPLLGLSIPQWSLLSFLVFAIVLGTVAFRRAR